MNLLFTLTYKIRDFTEKNVKMDILHRILNELGEKGARDTLNQSLNRKLY